jgi:hypothetical protein
MTLTGHAVARTSRRGPVSTGALAALVLGACAPAARQPPATEASLRRVAAAVGSDIYGRAVALGPLLAGRAVLYFFRTDCAHCAASADAARSLAGRPGAPALVLISREGPARLRAALGPAPRPGLVVVSDGRGAVMDAALPTRFVPRVVAVARFRVRLDATGARGPGLAEAVAALSRREP